MLWVPCVERKNIFSDRAGLFSASSIMCVSFERKIASLGLSPSLHSHVDPLLLSGNEICTLQTL